MQKVSRRKCSIRRVHNPWSSDMCNVHNLWSFLWTAFHPCRNRCENRIRPQAPVFQRQPFLVESQFRCLGLQVIDFCGWWAEVKRHLSTCILRLHLNQEENKANDIKLSSGAAALFNEFAYSESRRLLLSFSSLAFGSICLVDTVWPMEGFLLSQFSRRNAAYCKVNKECLHSKCLLKWIYDK